MAAVVKAAIYLADKAAENAAEPVAQSGNGCCPLCRLPLIRERNDIADIELDRCEEHGTWFDCGELQHVSNAMQAFRENWQSRIREEELRQLDALLAEQQAVAEEGPAKRFFRALGALLEPSTSTDHGGFEETH